MKNQYVKMGLFFGASLFIVSFLTMLYSDEGFTTKGVLVGLISAVLAGLLFGVLMQLFVKVTQKKIDFEFEPGEKMIKIGPANHFVGFESVGGKLCLTDKRLIFKSHKFNIQNNLSVIDLEDISTCEKTKTMGLISNGLKINTVNGKTEKFVVEGAGNWIYLIYKNRANILL